MSLASSLAVKKCFYNWKCTFVIPSYQVYIYEYDKVKKLATIVTRHWKFSFIRACSSRCVNPYELTLSSTENIGKVISSDRSFFFVVGKNIILRAVWWHFHIVNSLFYANLKAEKYHRNIRNLFVTLCYCTLWKFAQAKVYGNILRRFLFDFP